MARTCKYIYTPCTRKSVGMKFHLKDRIRKFFRIRLNAYRPEPLAYIVSYYQPVYPSEWSIR